MKEKLPVSKQIAYALGQFGWSLLSGIIGTYLVFYYIPTEKSEIVSTIPQIAFFGFLTIIGLITMLGRFFDAVTDPLIASMSDRCTGKKGRRITYMQRAALPFALTTVMVFWNPTMGESTLNALFLTVSLLLYYLFFTMYVTPYFALLSELGHTPEERLNLSTYISVTWFLGFALASQAPMLWNVFLGMGFEKAVAMRIAFSIFAVIGFVFLMIPVLFIDEKRYCQSVPTEIKMLDSIKATFANREFRVFALSDLVYWVAMTIFQNALLFYITVLLDKPEDMLGILFIFLGVGSFLFYAPVNLFAKRYGKKKLLILAFALFVITYVYGCFLGQMHFSTTLQAYILVFLASIPMAIFGILPNVVIADIADYDAKLTGVRREAMFFGVRTFVSKIGQMISMFLLSALLLVGKNGDMASGVRLTAVVAAVFCLAGLMVLLMYNEEKILSGLKTEGIKDVPSQL